MKPGRTPVSQPLISPALLIGLFKRLQQPRHSVDICGNIGSAGLLNETPDARRLRLVRLVRFERRERGLRVEERFGRGDRRDRPLWFSVGVIANISLFRFKVRTTG